MTYNCSRENTKFYIMIVIVTAEGYMGKMDIEHLDIHSDTFDDIVEEIKQKNLSRNNMPKLIVGTGLSVIYGVPGMNELALHLEREIDKSSSKKLKEIWKRHHNNIKKNGLEAGLASLTQEENVLVDAIKPITARYILESEEKLHEKILEKTTGFCKLLAYLSDTVSVCKKMIDIMTPNYDRIIEIVCDSLEIGVITGFNGNLYGKFNKNLLKQPTDVYNCKNRTWVRLFKPHGSINWINEEGNEYLTNDYEVLKAKAEYIEIVTPGSSKYKVGLTNNTFRCMREEFNEVLNSKENYSLLIYGYGFNDDHFDTALFDSFQKNVLIVSKYVKPEIINRALDRKNITVFYHEDDKECMIYKSKKYTIDMAVWDINQFADLFIG